MFKLSLFNVLNGQRFACSEMETWQCVPGVVDRGEIIIIQENPKIEARVGWHHQLTLGEERQIFCVFRIFFGGWGGRAAQKYKISTADTSPTSRNCQKYVDEKNT